MKRLLSITLIICVAFIFSVLSVSITDSWNVELVWEKNTELDLAGYRVFMREEGKEYNYTDPVIDVDTNVALLSGIPDGQYYWVVRAYDMFDVESGNSNEVEELLNLPPAPPVGCRTLSITQ